MSQLDGRDINVMSLINFLETFRAALILRGKDDDAFVVEMLVQFFREDFKPSKPLSEQKVIGL